MRSGVYGIVIERSWEIAAGVAGGADHCPGTASMIAGALECRGLSRKTDGTLKIRH
jgi:hypothetical protein